jgi:hypothetical protein
MASLKELLKATMLSVGAQGLLAYRRPPFPIRTPEPIIDDADDDDVYTTNSIWDFGNPKYCDAGVRVENVSCRVRSMNYMNMPVLREIEWGPVIVRSPDFGDVTLPLTDQFRIFGHYASDLSIKASTSGYWQLRANIDQGFEMIFGYEIPWQLVSSKPTPTSLSVEDWKSDQLMPDGDFSVLPADPGGVGLATLRLPPLRIVVVVSLVCCKERFDFVPGNLLGAARLYPLLMVVASSPLDSISASVKLTRPAKAAHTKMDGETMTGNIGSAMFTDRNNPGLSPAWDNIFDYYLIDPPAAAYTLVTPSDTGAPTTIPRAVTVHEPSGSTKRNVKKVAGQGEFDNLHIAPRMVLSEKGRTELNAGATGDEITMAPFCIHDCFHMHWRWSADFDDTFSKGWSGQAPFAKPGAPLVPGNQGVRLEMLSATSFRYTATAVEPVPGQWQVVMHHGAAYAVNADWKATFFKWIETGELPGYPDEFNLMPDIDKTWAKVYWGLRYMRKAKGRPVERLSWTADQFQALRAVK